MKKIISIFLILTTILISIISCNNTQDNELQNNQKESNDITNPTENFILESTTATYDILSDTIYWNKVENADGYYISINNGEKINVTDTKLPIPNYKPGYYSVSIEPYDNENIYKAEVPQTTQIRVNGFENEEEAKKKAINELTYHLVEINITQYNKGLFGVKKDKTTECVTGIIVKEENGYKYWCITYSPLLKEGYNYDVTNISVTDKYGTTYNAQKVNPTNRQNGILTVITFWANKKLPVVEFSNKIGEIEDVLLLAHNTNLYRPIITKIKEPDTDSYIQGTKTRYQTIITEQNWNITPDYRAVFDEYYNLIGIVVSNSKFGKIRFVQIKEVIEHFDLQLAEEYGFLTKTVLPVQ